MELRQFLRVIARYRYMIILMCFCAICTSVGLTYIISEKYTSSTYLLIRPQQSVDFVPKRNELLDFPVSYHNPVGTASKTYTEIVKSRIVSEKIVKALKLDELKAPEGSGLRYTFKKLAGKAKGWLVKGWTLLKYGRIEKGDAFSEAVSRVQKGLSVKPTKETYLFNLEAEAKSPELAASIANTAANVLIEYVQEMHSKQKQKTQQLSGPNLESARRQLKQAREAVVEFKKTTGIVSLDEETNLHLEFLFGLETSLKSVNTELEGALAQKQELAKQLAELEDFTKTSEKVIDNPVVRQLKLELAQKEVVLAGLRIRYSPEHRELKALNAEITEIENELKQQVPTLNSEVTTASNPVYQSLLKQQAELETQLESLRAQKDDLANEIEQKKKILDGLPVKEAELANLTLAATLEEQKYMLLSKEMQELEAAAKRQAPFVNQIHIAVPSLYPIRPIKVYHAALAGILSLIAGVGIVLLKEHANVTLRSKYEAEKALDLPVLMTIPRLSAVGKEKWHLMRGGREELPEVNRQYERIYVRFSVEIKGVKDIPATKGELVDISLGGACFCTDLRREFNPGQNVNLEVDFGKTSPEKVALEAVVVRSNEETDGGSRLTVGVKFVSLGKVSAEKITGLFRSREEKLPPLLPLEFEESIRGLRVDLELCAEAQSCSFLITSCSPKEGKSTLAANLALSLAGINKTTVIIDANLKNPSLHRIYELSNEGGLSGFLSDGTAPSLKKVASGLSVITSGPPVKDNSALLERRRMHKLVKSLTKDFDFVLIDAPALLSGADSAVLATKVDKAVMVLDSRMTTAEDSKRAKQILDKVNANILGAVMNNYDNNFGCHYAYLRN